MAYSVAGLLLFFLMETQTLQHGGKWIVPIQYVLIFKKKH